MCLSGFGVQRLQSATDLWAPLALYKQDLAQAGGSPCLSTRVMRLASKFFTDHQEFCIESGLYINVSKCESVSNSFLRIPSVKVQSRSMFVHS